MFSYFTSCVFSCDCCLLSQSNKEKKKKKNLRIKLYHNVEMKIWCARHMQYEMRIDVDSWTQKNTLQSSVCIWLRFISLEKRLIESSFVIKWSLQNTTEREKMLFFFPFWISNPLGEFVCNCVSSFVEPVVRHSWIENFKSHGHGHDQISAVWAVCSRAHTR